MVGSGAWASCSVDDPHIVEISDSLASLTYTARAVSSATDEYRSAITSVYALRDDTWSLVVHHQAPLVVTTS
jgi:hypothetical protein